MLGYIEREFYSPHLFEPILRDRKDSKLVIREEPSDTTSRIALIKWKLDVKKHYSNLSDYNNRIYLL